MYVVMFAGVAVVSGGGLLVAQWCGAVAICELRGERGESEKVVVVACGVGAGGVDVCDATNGTFTLKARGSGLVGMGIEAVSGRKSTGVRAC